MHGDRKRWPCVFSLSLCSYLSLSIIWFCVLYTHISLLAYIDPNLSIIHQSTDAGADVRADLDANLGFSWILSWWCFGLVGADAGADVRADLRADLGFSQILSLGPFGLLGADAGAYVRADLISPYHGFAFPHILISPYPHIPTSFVGVSYSPIPCPFLCWVANAHRGQIWAVQQEDSQGSSTVAERQQLGSTYPVVF